MKSEYQDSGSILKKIDSLNLSSKDLASLVCAFTDKGKSVQFRAKGDSMFPFIRNGEVISVRPFSEKKPIPGDIVAFTNPGTKNLIVHRIIKVSGSDFIAKGDNCFEADVRQNIGKIIGIVFKVNIRKSGTFYVESKIIRKCITFFSKIGLFAVCGNMLKKLKVIFNNDY